MDRHRELHAYGRVFRNASFLDVEYACYFAAKAEKNFEQAAKHFRNVTKLLWPPDEQGRGGYIWLSEDPDIPPESQWNDIMLMELLQNQFVGITGPASSLKSELLGVWALVNWIPLYDRCFVLVASTTIAGAKKRVWSSIKERFNKIAHLGIGRYTEYPQPMITANRGDDATRHLSDRCGIALIAPDSGKEGEAIGKLIGIKQEHFIVLADELDDMSPAITNAIANWSKNPDFQFVGATNIDSTLGTFGTFFMPEEGWENLSVDTLTWRCRNGGVGIHLDGEKSPNNYTKPIDKYPFIYKVSDREQDMKNYGATSAKYWRFGRGWPCPGGEEDNLYNELELISLGCMNRVTSWMAAAIPLAALDPNYSKARGDNCLAKFGLLGATGESPMVLDMGGAEGEFPLREDVTKLDEASVTKQKAVKFVALCRERNISVRQVAIDCSAGGSLMADAVEDAFGERGVLRIEFGGVASDLVVEVRENANKEREEITARDRYGDQAAELWHAGIPYVKNKQIKGLSSKAVQQMSKRKTFTKNRKVHIESKPDYKLRTSSPSPDEGDTGFIMLQLARQRFRFNATETLRSPSDSTSWNKAFERFRTQPARPAGRFSSWAR